MTTQRIITNHELTKSVTNPTRDGYKFIGWNTASNGSGVTWNFTSSLMPPQDVTLYAQWELDNYTLSFDVNDGKNLMVESYLIDYQELVTRISEPTRTGYTFIGWNTKIDGSGDTWDFETSIMPANHVTLYAQWEKWEVNTPIRVYDITDLTPLKKCLSIL